MDVHGVYQPASNSGAPPPCNNPLVATCRNVHLSQLGSSCRGGKLNGHPCTNRANQFGMLMVLTSATEFYITTSMKTHWHFKMSWWCVCVCRTSVYSGTSWIFRWCIRKSPIPLIESTFLEMTRSDTIPVFPKGLNVKGKGPSHGFVRPVAPPLLCYCMTSIYQRMRFFPCKLIYI